MFTGAMATCLMCGVGFSATPASSSTEIIQKFMQQIGLQGQGQGFSASEVSLCEDCHSGVVKATEWRDQVGEVDQVIVKMTRQLKFLQTQYLEEMRGLQWKIKSSEEGMARDGRQKGSQIAEAFRQGILDLTADLDENGVTTRSGRNGPLKSSSLCAVKIEPEESLEDSAPAPAGQPKDLLPPSTENDDRVDMDSEDPPKRKSLTPNKTNYVTPVVDASSGMKLRARKKESLNACKYCVKTFRRRSQLQQHFNTHTGERPYKCHLCPKTFKSTSNLNSHVLGHRGERPFTCPCGKDFTRKQNFTRHKKSHTGEKGFQCPVCGINFNSKRWMDDHLKRQHPNTPK